MHSTQRRAACFLSCAFEKAVLVFGCRHWLHAQAVRCVTHTVLQYGTSRVIEEK